MIVAMRPLSWLSLTDIFGSLGGLQCGLYHSLFGVSLSVSACGEFEEGLGFFAWAVPAGTEFLAALTVFGGGPHFAAGLGGFALCGACDAGVIRLGEDGDNRTRRLLYGRTRSTVSACGGYAVLYLIGRFGSCRMHSAVRSVVQFGGLLGCPPRVLWHGRVLGGSLLVRSLLGVGSVPAVAIFTGTVFALSASRDSGRRASAALSFLFFLGAIFFASQSFLLLVLLKC